VAYFDMTISQMQHDFKENVAVSSRRSAQQDSAEHLHTLLTQTLGQRQALDALVNTDIVSIVNAIDGVGSASGVTIQIQSTSPESTPPKSPKPIASTLAINIQTSGTFDQVMRAIKLLAALPIPTEIEQFDLNAGSGLWSAIIRVRIYTDATV
jgi:hypothetical protein